MLSSLADTLRLTWQHPATLRAGFVAFVAGTVGGAIPTGLLASPTGAGIGRGATWGLWICAALAPALATYCAIAIAGARYEHRVDQDLFLAGQPDRATMWRDAAAVSLVAVGLAVPAAVGGALSGAGDSLARATSIATPISMDAIAFACCALGWMALLGVVVVSAVRDAAVAVGLLLTWLVAGLAAVYVTASQLVWDLFSASPGGVLALAARDLVGARAGVSTHTELVVVGAIVWMTTLVATVVVRQRERAPRAPTR